MSVFAQFLLWIPPAPKKDTHPTAQCPWVQVVGMDLQIYPQISRRRLGVTLFKTMRSLRSYIHQKLKILVWKNILTQKAFFYSTYPKKSIEIHPKLFFFDIWIFLELCVPALHWHGIEKRESFGLFCMRDQSERLCKCHHPDTHRPTIAKENKEQQSFVKVCQQWLVLATLKHIQWKVCLIIIMAWYTTSCLQSSMSGINILMRVHSFSWVRISKRAQAKPNWLARSLKAW